MDNTDHDLNMVRESYSNQQAIAQYTRRVENGLRNGVPSADHCFA